jgi:hypothetical protein
MECICGCGREVSGRLTEVVLAAGEVATELLVWDKERTFGPALSDTDDLIDRGADLYQRLLAILHGDGPPDLDESCGAWLRESAHRRADRPEMTRGGFFADRSPKLEPSDVEQLDRRHPERSFSEARGGGNLVDELSRLGALWESGALTKAEFETAKGRLLRQGEGG